MDSATLADGIDIAARSALQIGALLAARLLDADEVADRTLAGIAGCDDRAIFTHVTADRAMAEARAARGRIRTGRPRSLLDGVPVAWKDLFDIEGLPTTAGSRALASAPPAARDAPIVTRLKSAGMVCVGRVNMSEFAFSGIGANPHYGTPRNPHGAGAARIPGGSSAGSAVAVARGLVPVAIGSDTGGSVRIPAALCGIVGFKASSGRYPMDGVFPLSRTLDTLGALVRTVEDAVIVDAAMCGLAAPGLQRRSLAGQRIVAPTNVVFDDIEPAVADNFAAALGRLEAAGAAVERVRLGAFDDILALTRRGSIASAEAYALHAARIDGEAAAAIDPRILARLRLGSQIPLADYIKLQQERRRLIGETQARFGAHALFALPTVPCTAPELALLDADDAAFHRVNARLLRNTMLGNFLDWCGVSIPSGTDGAGLPTALLLSASPGSDAHLLSAALTAESLIRGESP